MAYIGNSPANVGNYQSLDDISGSFNGSTTTFALTSGGAAMTPAKSSQLVINISGVIQQPDDAGANGFLVNATNIVFSSAPLSTDTFWGVYLGQSVDIGTPSNDTVDTAHIKDDAITNEKLGDGSVTNVKVLNLSAFGDIIENPNQKSQTSTCRVYWFFRLLANFVSTKRQKKGENG